MYHLVKILFESVGSSDTPSRLPRRGGAWAAGLLAGLGILIGSAAEAQDRSNDAMLSALTITDSHGPVTLSPPFDPATASYTAQVAHDVETVTVAATPGHDGAGVVLFPADSDPANGHQVAMGTEGGTVTLTATVTAEDGQAIETYMIGITRTPLGVCDRTAQVADAILGKLNGVSACADVTTDHLGNITGGLDVGEVDLTALLPGDFNGLTSLNLRQNALTSLPAGVFDETTLLGTLILQDNQLESLPEGVFDTLTKMGFLVLSSNRLESLPAGVFDNSTKLTAVYLNDNQLMSLPDRVFEKLTGGVEVYLGDNPGLATFTRPEATAVATPATISDAAGNSVTLDGELGNPDTNPWGMNVIHSWELTDPASGLTVTYDPDDDSPMTTATVTEALTNIDTLTFTLTVRGAGDPQLVNATVDEVDILVSTVEATLHSLALADSNGGPVTLSPGFADATTSYVAEVKLGVDEVTFTAEASHIAASIAFADGDGNLLTDHDDMTDGFQVAFPDGTGATTVKMTVTQATSVTKIYEVMLYREPFLRFAETQVTVTESADTDAVTLTVELVDSSPPSHPRTRTVSALWGTQASDISPMAEQGKDYFSQTGTAVFVPGVTSSEFRIAVSNDDIHERPGAPEHFRVRLAPPSGGAVLPDPDYFVTIRIEDDDAPAASVAPVTVNEGDGVMTLLLELGNPSDQAITYTFDPLGIPGTAMAGTDYTVPTPAPSVTFPACPTGMGCTLQATVDIPVSDDTVAEDDRTIVLHWDVERIGGVLPVAPGSERITFTGVIVDDDPPPQVTGVMVTEGDAQLTAEWAAADFADGYKVQWKSAGQSFANAATDGREVVIGDGATISHIIPDLTNDTEYDVQGIAHPDPYRRRTGGERRLRSPGVRHARGVAAEIATLNKLTLVVLDGDAVALSPAFVPDSDSDLTYTAGVADDVATVTAAAMPTDNTASVAFSPPDSSTRRGHQVALGAVGETVALTATVTTANGSTLVYTINITPMPQVSFDPPFDIVDEDVATGKAVLAVILSSASEQTVTVEYATRQDSPALAAPLEPALEGVDYTAVSDVLTFMPGQTRRMIEIPVTDDNIHESASAPNERFSVELSNPQGATLPAGSGSPAVHSANVFIGDNETPPGVSAARVTVDEGDGVMTLTLELGAPSDRAITYALDPLNISGTATPGADYTVPTPAPSTTFPACPTGTGCTLQATVDIPIVNDTVAEGDERMRLRLAVVKPSDTTPVATGSERIGFTGIIVDDDAPGPVTGVTVMPGNAQLTVNWDALTHADGYRVQWVPAASMFGDAGVVIQEAAVEGDAATSYTITGLTNGAGYRLRVIATRNVTIAGAATVADGTPSAEETDAPIAPSDVATLSALTLVTPDGGAVALSPAFVPDSDSDLTYTAGVADGVATVTVAATPSDDRAGVVFSPADSDGNPANGHQVAVAAAVGESGTLTATVTAEDGDTEREYTVTISRLPLLEFSAAGYVVGEDDGAVEFAVTLTPASRETVTVTYATGDDTGRLPRFSATADVDYTAVSGGTLTFAPGDTEMKITVTLLDDEIYEGDSEILYDESFGLYLTDPAGAVLPDGLPEGFARVSIHDDDPAPMASMSVTPDPLVVDEGGAMQFTLALDRESSLPITYNPATSGTATRGDDYTLPEPASITVPPGALTVTYDIAITDDRQPEPDETIGMTWNRSIGGLATPRSFTLVTGAIEDDDPLGQVMNVSVESGDRELEVYWTSVDFATGYKVQWKSGAEGFNNNREAVIDDGAATSHTITGLTNGTTYTVRVIATLSGAADGAPSADRTGEAGNIAPVFTDGTSATRSIAGTADGATEQTARDVGEPVAATDADIGDTLTYSLVESAASANFDIDAMNGQIRTEVGESYNPGSNLVVIIVSDGKGGTDAIPVIINVIDSDAVPPAPAAPVVTAVSGSANSLNAGWNAPDNANRLPISGYDLRYRAGSSEPWIDGPEDVTSTSTRIAGLTAATEYQVQVRATNGVGYGSWSPSGTGSTNALSVLSFGETVVEIDETGGLVELTVNLGPASIEPVSVNFATQDETATPGEDYTATSGTLTFMPGETSKTFTVPILIDSIHETANESFLVVLGSPSGATLPASPSAQVIIIDDVAPTASMQDVTVNEGDATMTLTLRLDRPSDRAVVYFTDGNGNGVSGTAVVTDDYDDFLVNPNTTITVPAGEVSATFGITIVNDDVAEDSKTIVIEWRRGSGTGAMPQTITFTGTIDDDDLLPQVTGVTVTPGDGSLQVGWTPVDTADGYIVQWKSAEQSFDSSREAVIGGGATTGYRIPGLTNGTGYDVQVIATRTALANGPASDPAVSGTPTRASLAIADATAQEGEELTFTVTLTPAVADPVTVSYATSNGTATAGGDYTAVPSTGLTFAPGQTSQTITVATLSDAADEDDETFTVTLSGASSNATITTATATGAITDGDAPGVTVSESALTVTEEDATGDSYTVVLDTEPTADVTVTVAGHAGTDVTPNPTTLTFTSLDWNTPRTVTVTADNDGDTDNDTVTLTHSAASSDGNYSSIAIPGVTVTVLDNDTAQVTGVMVTEGNGQLVVEWTAVSNATGYRVQWKSDGEDYNTGDRQATVTSGSTISHTIGGLANGAEYMVRVIATRSGANDGPPSAEVMGMPEEPTAPGVTVSGSPLTVTEEDTTGDSYTVVLDTEPTADVTVTVAGHAGTDVTPNPTTLTFTSLDWDTPRTVTVTADNDGDTDNETVTLTHSATSSDGDYSSIAIPGVTVTVLDTTNTPATGAPVISGTAQVGEVLTATTGGIADADGLPGSFTWQWLRVDSDSDGVSNETMIGANAATYTLAEADEGARIRVRVSFTDDAGNPEALTSAAWPSSGMIAPSATPLSTDATLRALALAGANGGAIPLNQTFAPTLTAYTADVANGVGQITLTPTLSDDTAMVAYLDASDTVIDDANMTTPGFQVALTEGANEIRVRVTAEDDSTTQTYMLTVTRAANTPATGEPLELIAGGSNPPQVGDMLMVNTDAIVDEDGLENATFLYQWFRVEGDSSARSSRNVTGNIMVTDIPGATLATYMLVAADEGAQIGVKVSFTNDANNFRTLTSAATGAVIAAAIPDRTAPVASWLPRFGRTVSEQVVETAQARMAATPVAGLAGQLAGQTIAIAPGRGSAEARADAEADFAALGESFFGAGDATGNAWDDTGDGRDGAAERGYSSRALTGRDFLTGSAFALTGDSGDSAATLWGRGAVTSFDGRDGSLSLDGEVVSGMLGIDWRNGERSGGLMLSRSRGEGDYRSSAAGGAASDDGRISATLTGLYPWLGHRVNDRLTLWGVAGYGRGTLTLTPAGEDALSAGIGLTMGSVGARGRLGAGAEGVVLAWEADALALRTTSDAASGVAGRLDATSSGMTRVRLGLTGSRRFRLGSGAVLTPGLEVGLRHDGGDAETGFGTDIGVSLDFADPARGITAAVSARGLLDHAAQGFRERGLSATLTWDQRPGSDLGWSLSLGHGVGAATEGGAASLLARQSLAGLLTGDGDDGADTTDGDLQRRFDATLGYGVPMAAGRFVAVSGIGFGLTDAGREYSVGWRLGLARSGPMDLHLRLEATRQESTTGSPTHDLGLDLGAAIRW